MRRDWSLARAKCDIEGRCRVCGEGPVEAAHTIGRAYDDELAPGVVQVNPNSVVPLDAKCHRLFDARELDLLPHMSLWEQADAVGRVGLERARHRLCPSLYAEVAAP